MGFYLLHESMLESIIYARDHFLRKTDDEDEEQASSPVIFPSHAYLYCAPFVDDHIRFEKCEQWTNYFDLNLKPLLKHMSNVYLDECVVDQTIEPSQLVCDPQLIYSIDLKKIHQEDLKTIKTYCEFFIENDCIISGFAFWFDCYFSSTNSQILQSTLLSTSPHQPKTHWKQSLVFLKDNIYPVQNDLVPIQIKLKQEKENHRQYKLSILLKEIKNNGGDDGKKGRRRRRRRRRSSTISKTDSSNDDETNGTTSTSSEQEEEEHPIPCLCERARCKLIKAIVDKYEEENVVE